MAPKGDMEVVEKQTQSNNDPIRFRTMKSKNSLSHSPLRSPYADVSSQKRCKQQSSKPKGPSKSERHATNATFASQMYAPSMCKNDDSLVTGGGSLKAKHPSLESRTPPALRTTARSITTKECVQAHLEKKFADSYCSQASFLRSRNKTKKCRNKTIVANTEKGLKDRIEKYKRTFDAHNMRIQSQVDLAQVPIIRVLRNLIMNDLRRTIRLSWVSWKRFTSAKRHEERRLLLFKNHCWVLAEEVVARFMTSAVKVIVPVKVKRSRNKPPTIREDQTNYANKIQKVYRSRSLHQICLTPCPDGRVSIFGLPDLTKYSSKYRGREEHLVRDEINAKNVQSIWGTHCEPKNRKANGTTGRIRDKSRKSHLSRSDQALDHHFIKSKHCEQVAVSRIQEDLAKQLVFEFMPVAVSNASQPSELLAKRLIFEVVQVAVANASEPLHPLSLDLEGRPDNNELATDANTLLPRACCNQKNNGMKGCMRDKSRKRPLLCLDRVGDHHAISSKKCKQSSDSPIQVLMDKELAFDFVQVTVTNLSQPGELLTKQLAFEFVQGAMSNASQSSELLAKQQAIEVVQVAVSNAAQALDLWAKQLVSELVQVAVTNASQSSELLAKQLAFEFVQVAVTNAAQPLELLAKQLVSELVQVAVTNASQPLELLAKQLVSEFVQVAVSNTSQPSELLAKQIVLDFLEVALANASQPLHLNLDLRSDRNKCSENAHILRPRVSEFVEDVIASCLERAVIKVL